MRIIKTSLTNIDKLYETIVSVADGTPDGAIPPRFNKKATESLMHCEISFHIEDITLFEYMYLLNHASIVKRISNVSFNQDTVLETTKAFGEDTNIHLNHILSCMDKYSSILTSIYPDVSKLASITLPMSLTTVNCIAKYQGSQIFSILNTSIEEFINEVSIDNETNIRSSYQSIEGYIQDVLETKFIQSFYDDLVKSIRNIDRVSELFIHNNFAIDTPIEIGSVNTPFTIVDIYNDEFDSIISRIKESSKIYKDLDPYLRESVKDDIHIEYRLNTSILIYFILKELLPKGSIISEESWMMLVDQTYSASKNAIDSYYRQLPIKAFITNDNITTLVPHVNAFLTGIRNELHECSESGKTYVALIPCYQTIMPFSNISFSISLTLNDIIDYIPLVGDQFLKTFGYLHPDIEEIQNRIIKYAKTMYNNFQ